MLNFIAKRTTQLFISFSEKKKLIKSTCIHNVDNAIALIKVHLDKPSIQSKELS